MLEKPDLQDEKICACLCDAYGITVAQIAFLPWGADRNTAVYRVSAVDSAPYFLKLRKGVFDETSVALPRFLSDQGVKPVIAPVSTTTGELRAELEEFKAILYPFVDGRDGYDVALSAQQWRDFGAALKQIHTLDVPATLTDHIRRETYAPRWCETLRMFMGRLDEVFDDPVAVQLIAFLKAKRDEILFLIQRAETLACALQRHSPELVLCHADLHAGNILLDEAGAFYIVDWDDPILASKERDLMYIGGAQGFISHGAPEEERLFYQGYGQTEIDPAVLSYYRYARIVEDLAIYCEELLLTTAGGEDRAQSLHYVKSNFAPGGTIDMARRADQILQYSTA